MSRRDMARILAVTLAVFWAVIPAKGADVLLTRVSGWIIEVKGEGWHLQYGTAPTLRTEQLLPVSGDRAYFSHGSWLRLVDTRNGIVIGRWHFPAQIVHLTLVGDQLEVQVQADDSRTRPVEHMLRFNPTQAILPYWPTGSVLLGRLSQTEAIEIASDIDWLRTEIPIAQAKQKIPDFEEVVRRDPLSPWLRVRLAKCYRTSGDPRATIEFQEAVRTPTTDFTELLPISAWLDEIGERDVARKAFERGFRDFWERGNDPRLMTTLIFRLMTYGKPQGRGRVEPEFRHELIERFYRLSPYNEAAELAWQLYADELQKQSDTQRGRLWSDRARDARSQAFNFVKFDLWRIHEQTVLVFFASIVSAVLYLVVLDFRYRPQLRLQLAAGSTQGLFSSHTFFTFQYWNRRQRLAFFIIALAGWISYGAVADLTEGLARHSAMPISLGTGSLAGPSTAWYLSQGLPKTPERELLRAMSDQHSGEDARAESLYRSLPQFAESWNNLGVLLKNRGEASAAREAFQKALKLSPGLAEAQYNLGHPPPTLWTELHEKYLPGRPMIAPPSKQHQTTAFHGSRAMFYLHTLSGPFGSLEALSFIFTGRTPIPKLMALTLVVLMALAVALLFIVPIRDVTQAPSRALWAGELMIPGTSPAWHLWGGPALLAWSYFLLRLLLRIAWRSPYLVHIYLPNLSVYGVVPAPAEIHRLLDPTGRWLYIAAGILFAVNLVLVLRRRRSERLSIATGQS